MLDKAGWHTSHHLDLPLNIHLMHLPAYSPELNPVDLLRRETRAKYFNNRIFASLDEVEDTLSLALAAYHKDKDYILQLSMGC